MDHNAKRKQISTDNTGTRLLSKSGMESLMYNYNGIKYLKKCKQNTMDTQLRWFQLRIVHHIVPTNKYLFLCKICDSPVGAYHNREDDTISHLFWSCYTTKHLWTDLAVSLKDIYMHYGSLTFSEIFILFSVD